MSTRNYIDLENLSIFWNEAKSYINNLDQVQNEEINNLKGLLNQNITDLIDQDKIHTEDIAAIKEYTVNNIAIKNNPVLSGSNIKLGASIGDDTNFGVDETLISILTKIRERLVSNQGSVEAVDSKLDQEIERSTNKDNAIDQEIESIRGSINDVVGDLNDEIKRSSDEDDALKQRVKTIEDSLPIYNITDDTDNTYIDISFSKENNNVTASIDETVLSQKIEEIEDYQVNNYKLSDGAVTLTSNDIKLGTDIDSYIDAYKANATIYETLTQLKRTIAATGGGSRIVAVLDELPETTDGFSTGDIILVDLKEYLCAPDAIGSVTTKWYLLGDVTDEGRRLSEIEASYVKSVKVTGSGVNVSPTEDTNGNVTINVDASNITQRLTVLENENKVSTITTTDGTYVKLTPDSTSTGDVNITVDDSAISTSLEGRVSKTGDTMSGPLTIESGNDTKIVLNNTDADDKYQHISFQQNGSEYGKLGTSWNDNISWNGNVLLRADNVADYALPITGGTMLGAINLGSVATQPNVPTMIFANGEYIDRWGNIILPDDDAYRWSVFNGGSPNHLISVKKSLTEIHNSLLTSHTTINGNFFVKPTSTGSYNEGIRIYNAPNNWAGIGFGFHESDESLPSDGWWAAVNPSREFIISAGGSDNHLGLKLIKNGEAYWRNQEILHSGNVQNYKRSICDKYSGIRTSSGYTKLGVLPANAATTYDVFRITGSIGGWDSIYKSIVDLHISNRGVLSISGYIHNFGTEYWDIYVNDSLEIILYSRNAYTAWDIEISSFQSTIDYQPDYTPSNTNWITSAHSSDHVTKFDINGNLLNKAVNIKPDVLYKKYDQKSGSDTPFTYSYGLTMSSIYDGKASGWPINFGNAITARDTGTTQLIVTWNENQTASNPNFPQELFIRSQRDSAGDNWSIPTRVLTAFNYPEYCLPLTGGTMTGTTQVNSSSFPQIILNHTGSANETGIRFEMNGENKGYVGYHNSYGTYLWNSASYKYLCLGDDGEGYISSSSTGVSNKLLHLGNYSSYVVPLSGVKGDRLTTTGGMPSGFETGNRGTKIWSNGISFCDPYLGSDANDSCWIRHLETNSNSGYMEFGMGDDGDTTEVFHFRKYNTSNQIVSDVIVPAGNGTLAFDNQHWKGIHNTDQTISDAWSTSITEFFDRINVGGLFSTNFSAMRGTWYYAGNTQYNTGKGTLDMAGTAVINISQSCDTTADYKSLLFLDYNGHIWTYASEEPGYSHWRRIMSSDDQTFNNSLYAPNFIISSDKRLKKNIKSVDDDKLQKSLDLNLYEFDYKNTDGHSAGHIAQEVQEVLPEYVRENECCDGQTYLALDYTGLHSMQIKALKMENQELRERIEKLEKIIEKLI